MRANFIYILNINHLKMLVQPITGLWGSDYMLFYPFYIFACMLYLLFNVSVHKTNVSNGYR